MKYFTLLLIISVFFSLESARGQVNTAPVSEVDASDPVTMNSRVTADLETYFFVADARYYAVRMGYEYGLQNQKHLFGLSLPIVHNIFIANFAGFENTTGIGDLKMRYMFVPHNGDDSGMQRVSAYFEMTAPTGESALGRGTGTWVYKPGVIFTFRPNPFVTFYPEVKYSFSTQEANSLGGDSAPDQSDPAVDGLIQNMTVSVPAVVLVASWQGWVAMNASYIQSFSDDTYFLFLRLDFGKMIGKKTSAALTVSKFIAGQPRLDAVVQAKFQFFLP